MREVFRKIIIGSDRFCIGSWVGKKQTAFGALTKNEAFFADSVVFNILLI
jgi:hypothetical protein